MRKNKRDAYNHKGEDYSAYIVEQVIHIESVAIDKPENKRAAYISNSCNRLVKAELSRLGYIPDKDTGVVDKSAVKCSYTTYLGIVNSYRNSIKALGYKHHSLNRSIETIINKFNHIYPDLSVFDVIKQKGDLKKYLNPSQSLSTLRDKLTILRSKIARDTDFGIHLKKLKIEHHLFYLFKPIDTVLKEVKNNSKEKLKAKTENRILVNPSWAKDIATKLINDGATELEHWLSLRNYIDGKTKGERKLDKHRSKKIPYASLAVGLGLASGRRVTEIMRTGNFLPAKNENEVTFTGQLKTKNRKLFEELKGYDIPLLVDRDLFLNGFAILRKFCRTQSVEYINDFGDKIEQPILSGPINDTKKNVAIAQKYTSTLNLRIKTLFSNGSFTFKDTRAIAAKACQYFFNENFDTEKNFLTRYLGHAKGEKAVFEYYNAFEIDTNIASVEFITGDRTGEKTKNNADNSIVKDSEFLTFLENNTKKIAAYSRAPKWVDMHEWLIERVKAGVNRLDILAEAKAVNDRGLRQTNGVAILRSYFRKNCFINNKGVSPQSVLAYLQKEEGLNLKDDLTFVDN